MDPEVKVMWVEALSSPDQYTQQTGALRSPNGFCCLGVLCDLYRKTSGKKGKWKDYTFLGNTTELPLKVMQWAGLNENNPIVKVTKSIVKYEDKHAIMLPPDHGDATTLAALNDAGFSFKKIAKIIDKQL